jgi:hypothetical protein
LFADDLRALDFAWLEDQKAGKATWALYETQKKLVDACNSFEMFITFRMDHLFLDEAEKQDIQGNMAWLAFIRRYIRWLGPKVVKAQQRVMGEEENDPGNWD